MSLKYKEKRKAWTQVADWSKTQNYSSINCAQLVTFNQHCYQELRKISQVVIITIHLKANQQLACQYVIVQLPVVIYSIA